MLGLQLPLNFGCPDVHFLHAIKAAVRTTKANETSITVKFVMKVYIIINYSPQKSICASITKMDVSLAVLWCFRIIYLLTFIIYIGK